MEKLIIEGGRELNGELKISGAKNAALPLIAATLLAPGIHTLTNVPDLRDTRTIFKLLESLGVTWQRNGSTVTVDSNELNCSEVSYDLVKTMRASVLVLGPLLARLGRAKVSLPGGCAIGARPINFHIKGFEQLGVTCSLDHGYVGAHIDGRMQGNVVYFDVPSVTGTENLLMAAALAKGTTVIKNAAREPEIGNLVDMLVGMGADIEGRDSDRLIIHGVKKLKPTTSEIIADRIEAGTYLIAVAATGGEVTVSHCNPAHLPSLLEKLREAGVEIDEDGSSITIRARGEGTAERLIKSVDIKTMPYPGYPTDLQAQFMALMTLGSSVCVINETIFENRFMHVAELRRMGADIRIDGRSAIIKGIANLSGAQVMATDLRASASLVIAALAAEGETQISRVYHLDRGYDDLAGKLNAVGADIRRVQE